MPIYMSTLCWKAVHGEKLMWQIIIGHVSSENTRSHYHRLDSSGTSACCHKQGKSHKHKTWHHVHLFQPVDFLLRRVFSLAFLGSRNLFTDSSICRLPDILTIKNQSRIQCFTISVEMLCVMKVITWRKDTSNSMS